MEIKSSSIGRLTGTKLEVIYRDIDSLSELGSRTVNSVHAFCFCGDKLVIVFAKGKGIWSPPGGGIEKGEGVEEAVAREALEETSMRVIRQKLIGYQDVFEPDGVVTQTKSVCIVELVSPFVSDPDGDVTEIKLINPKDYKKYFYWGEVGDRIMQRALELKDIE